MKVKLSTRVSMLSVVVLLGVVFFAHKAEALSILFDNSITTDGAEYAEKGQDWNSVGFLFRATTTVPSFYYPTQVDNFGYAQCIIGACTSTYTFEMNIYRLTTTTTAFVAGQEIATSNPQNITWTGQGIKDFDPFVFPSKFSLGNYWYLFDIEQTDTFDGTDKVRVFQPIDIGATADWIKMVRRSQASGSNYDTAPTSNPKFVFYTDNAFSSQTLTNTSTISFTSPPPNSEWNVNQPIPFFGTCTGTTTLDLLIKQDYYETTDCGTETCQYEDNLVEDIACIANEWNIGTLTFDTSGHYWLRLNQGTAEASEYVNVDWRTYNDYTNYNNATTTCSIIKWQCDFPLIGPVCSTLSKTFNWTACYAQNTINWNVEALRSSEPFSYAFSVADAIYSGINNSTTPSSTSLNLSIPIFGQSTEIFNATSSVASIPSQTLSDLRPWFEKGIYILFGIYIIALIL